MQDSIVAEDLGRFPDANVADSLSHITGITISAHARRRGPVRERARPRARRTASSRSNGRILATDGDGREFAFDVLPSEVISGADVYKSADAAHLEGSIGGTINLTSARPLDQPGLHTRFSVEGDYNDLSEDNGYKASGVFSNTFADDTHGRDAHGGVPGRHGPLGRRAGVLHQPGFAGRVRRRTATATISADESDLLGLCCTSFGARIQQKKRTGVTGRVAMEGQRQLQHDASTRCSRGSTRRPSAITSPTTSRIRSSTRTPARTAGATSASRSLGHRHDGRRAGPGDLDDHRVPRRGHHAVRLERRVAGDRQLTFDVRCLPLEVGARFRRQGHLGGLRHRGQSHRPRRHEQQRRCRTSRVTLEDGRDLATALAGGELGNADYGLHYIGLSGTDVNDTVTGFTLGGTLDGRIGRVQVAVSSARRAPSAARRATRSRTTPTAAPASTAIMYATTFASLGADVVRSCRCRTSCATRAATIRARSSGSMCLPYLEALHALDGQPILDENGDPTGEVYDAAATAPEFNPVQSYDVEEDTNALYLKADFERGPVVCERRRALDLHRHDRAHGHQRASCSSTIRRRRCPLPVPTSLTAKRSRSRRRAAMTSCCRPSMPATGSMMSWCCGWRAARVMARPSLNQLAPTRTDNTLDRTFAVFYDGNAELEPVERGPGGSVDGVVFRREVGAQCRGVLEEHRGLHHLLSSRRTSTSASSAASAARPTRRSSTT